jgi:hypothetical protein
MYSSDRDSGAVVDTEARLYCEFKCTVLTGTVVQFKCTVVTGTVVQFKCTVLTGTVVQFKCTVLTGQWCSLNVQY